MSAHTEQSHFPKGHRLGPYEIASSIGAGGMGEVFRARDMRHRDVAVKVLPKALRFTTALRLFAESLVLAAGIRHGCHWSGLPPTGVAMERGERGFGREGRRSLDHAFRENRSH